MKINTILVKVIVALVIIVGLSSCTKQTGPMVAAGDVDYYTCTMHPWVHSKKPGTCPVCAMDLVPVYKSKSPGDQAIQTGNAGGSSTNSKPIAQPESHDFDVPVERQQQFGVTYAQAKRERLVRTVRTVGLVSADKGRQWMYVPRTDGYVQKLYITSPGQR